MSNSKQRIYVTFNSKTESDTDTPHFTHATKEGDEWVKHSISNIVGEFTGAWMGKTTYKDVETHTFNINIETPEIEYILQLKYFKSGYDFINIMSGVDPGAQISITVDKTKDKKGKYWPSIDIRYLDIAKPINIKVPFGQYPKAVLATNGKGVPLKDKTGKDIYDHTAPTEFWVQFFKDELMSKFAGTRMGSAPKYVPPSERVEQKNTWELPKNDDDVPKYDYKPTVKEDDDGLPF